MGERVKKLLKMLKAIAIAIFFLLWLIKKPITVNEYISCLSYTFSSILIFTYFYKQYLWKYIPWNRPPILKQNYDGKIFYNFNSQPGVKEISVSIKQTWLSVVVTTRTDINESYTIMGDIVEEHGEYVLYYTYLTNPSAHCLKENPIQYGTCKMKLNDSNEELRGNYWTTSKTIGELVWKAVPKL